MIRRKTVLVLGAGASMPYGFPSGYELLQLVCGHPNDPTGSSKLTRELASYGFDQRQTTDFLSALGKSGRTSVDAFLEHRPEFIEVGKAAIAYFLIKCERPDLLFSKDIDCHWYEYLFNKLNAKIEDFKHNKLSIITYNYDRSIEYFLTTAIQNSYGVDEKEAKNTLQLIPIVHLHGQLGELESDYSESGRPYQPLPIENAVKIAYNGIRIIHEGIDNEPQFSRAHELIRAADVICFLGFGYNVLNISRLRKSLTGKAIVGSTYGLTYAESRAADKALGHRGMLWQAEKNNDCLDFLRENGLLDE